MINLYTTYCPQCEALEKKLNDKHIKYEVHTDMKEMHELGFLSVPMLEVDGEYMGFMDAIRWVNNQ